MVKISLSVMFFLTTLFTLGLAHAEEPVILDSEKTSEQIKKCLLIKGIYAESPLEFANTPDPLEPINRLTFEINRGALVVAVRGIGRGYDLIMPKIVKEAISRFTYNVGTPARVLSNILQLKLANVGIELTRLVINSSIGIGGLMDPAKAMGIRAPPAEDLGQVLGHWGIGPGLYIVVPISGGTNLRDFVGSVGESFIDPFSFLPKIVSNAEYLLTYNEMMVNNTGRRDLRYLEISFDPYYLQRTVDDLASTARACE